MALRYAVHAYAWTTSWSNDTLHLIDHTNALGFDLIEIPLMEIDKVDAAAIRERLESVGLGVCTSTACSAATTRRALIRLSASAPWLTSKHASMRQQTWAVQHFLASSIP